MFRWMARRAQELIIAFMLVALMIWLVVTQPVANPPDQQALLRLDAKKLETNMLALGEFKGEFIEADDSMIVKSADYLVKQLTEFGTIESRGYSASLHQINLQIGKVKIDTTNPNFPLVHPRLVLVVHHVLSPQPAWDGAKSLAGLIELAARLQTFSKNTSGYSFELVIYIHHAQNLSQTVMSATQEHVNYLVREERSHDRVLVWMPGILLPDAYTESSHWGFLAPAVPSNASEVQLYSRLADYQWLRETKTIFKQFAIDDVQSLTVPSSFPKVRRFPLNTYWEKNIAAILIRTRLVGVNQDYADLMRFLTALERLLQQPVVSEAIQAAKR